MEKHEEPQQDPATVNKGLTRTNRKLNIAIGGYQQALADKDFALVSAVADNQLAAEDLLEAEAKIEGLEAENARLRGLLDDPVPEPDVAAPVSDESPKSPKTRARPAT